MKFYVKRKCRCGKKQSIRDSESLNLELSAKGSGLGHDAFCNVTGFMRLDGSGDPFIALNVNLHRNARVQVTVKCENSFRVTKYQNVTFKEEL